MSGFSSILKLTNLDDFITPSQECIKPFLDKQTSSDDKSKTHLPIGDVKSTKKVEITIADCLSCSGCITSAESVLISEQSETELLNVLADKQHHLESFGSDHAKLIVASISHQAILSLAVHYDLEANVCAAKFSTYLKGLGIDLVVDLMLAEAFTLLESQKEFLQRYNNTANDEKKLPILSSTCPGWICYAEKTHGDFILPYVSAVKSPQQIMGAFIKNYLKSTTVRDIYHVSIMPCFDKKLEAARNEFFNVETNRRDVDCVITTIEIQQMLYNQNVDLRDIPEGTFNEPWISLDMEKPPNIVRHEGSGSGGYAQHVFNSTVQYLHPDLKDQIQCRDIRNPDFREISVDFNDGTGLKFAVVNGFRNIQNLVQKLKRNNCPYHFVEIMACPAGCLNGGAQLRPTDNNNSVTASKQLVRKLDEAHTSLPISPPSENRIVLDLYKRWLSNDNDNINQMLYTTYRPVAKVNHPLTIKW